MSNTGEKTNQVLKDIKLSTHPCFHHICQSFIFERKKENTDNEEVDGNKEAFTMKSLPSKDDNPGGGVLPETNSLLFMIENPEYNHLLEHPVVKSFLSLKFWGVASLYIIKTFFFLIFASFVTAYVFLVNNVAKEGVESAEAAMKWIVFVMLLLLALLVLAILFDSLKESVTNLAALTKVTEEEQSPEIGDLFMIKKAFKPFTRLLSDSEWWLKLGVFISCLLLMFTPKEEGEKVRHLSATCPPCLDWIPLPARHSSVFCTP